MGPGDQEVFPPIYLPAVSLTKALNNDYPPRIHTAGSYSIKLRGYPLPHKLASSAPEFHDFSEPFFSSTVEEGKKIVYFITFSPCVKA